MTNRTHRDSSFWCSRQGWPAATMLRTSPTVPSTTWCSRQRRQHPAAPATYHVAEVTLSGVVYEMTPTGMVPIEGVDVYCEPCGEETQHVGVHGFKRVLQLRRCGSARARTPWVNAGTTLIWVGKDGFADPPGHTTSYSAEPSTGPGWREVTDRRRHAIRH